MRNSVEEEAGQSQGRSQNFSMEGAKPHNFSSNSFNILNKFPAHNHIEIKSEVEQNYRDNFGIEFVVEIKKYMVYKNILILPEIHYKRYKIL